MNFESERLVYEPIAKQHAQELKHCLCDPIVLGFFKSAIAVAEQVRRTQLAEGIALLMGLSPSIDPQTDKICYRSTEYDRRSRSKVKKIRKC